MPQRKAHNPANMAEAYYIPFAPHNNSSVSRSMLEDGEPLRQEEKNENPDR